MKEKEKKSRPALLILRAVAAFVLLGALVALLYWWGYDSYRDVAEWSVPGYRDAVIMDGKTYLQEGRANTNKYPLGDLLGEVKDDGVDVITEVASEAPTEDLVEDTDESLLDTEPEETESETETYEELPSEVVSFVKGDHAYLVYAVEKKEDMILILFPDGKYYLYVLETPETETE